MTQPKVSLPKQVAQTREQLLTLLREAAPESAQWVEQVRARRRKKPSVVVVGETNRGKSSLVNAMIDTPGLSPVDADVATATYLVFGHAEQWEARACYPGQLAPVPVDIAKLVNWVSAAHELPDGELPPRYVEVDGPVPLLEKLVVVDTPGVGGLDSVHGELAIEAAASATALLFVVDASAPFTVGELSFLANVGDRVETVVFVLSKVDAYRGWRQVLEANKALLVEHAPRFKDAIFHPVSSRMFELAGKAPNPEAAEMLKERSGIAELVTSLQSLLVGRSAMLGEANTLRALSSSLGELKVTLENERRALTTGEAEAEALRSRKDELTAERRSSTRGWQVKLRSEVQRARLENAHEVSRQMRDLQAWFRQAIDVADRDQLRGLPAHVDAAMQMVSGKVSESVGTRLNQVADSVLSELFSEDELAVIRGQFARAGTSQVVLRAAEKRLPTAEDKLLVFMGVSGGIGAGKMAVIPLAGAIAAPILLVPTIVIGLGAGWWIARTRKHTADKQHMKLWLNDSIADARSTLDQLVSEQLIDAESQLSLALDEALGKRITGIEEQLREVDKALRLDVSERQKRVTVVNKRLTDVVAGQERAERLLAGIRSVRDKN
ncbi:dynamin family protein [Actinokineospora globicatena]|uniref:dynamin family protein n=1 Tax=Actinokineospora globicatena TaxID=103729 RepID=UPI0020A60F71|nr:dynamin family protein [Actinokineospora globicatena]MCP2301328.1 Dynamin family protein [Actinokineospora globicatena]GLW77033.1 dynamin [Actinokineospora globicatena]GLW83867.1 dynamin [Actinokineospora globicatena]